MAIRSKTCRSNNGSPAVILRELPHFRLALNRVFPGPRRETDRSGTARSHRLHLRVLNIRYELIRSNRAIITCREGVLDNHCPCQDTEDKDDDDEFYRRKTLRLSPATAFPRVSPHRTLSSLVCHSFSILYNQLLNANREMGDGGEEPLESLELLGLLEPEGPMTHHLAPMTSSNIRTGLLAMCNPITRPLAQHWTGPSRSIQPTTPYSTSFFSAGRPHRAGPPRKQMCGNSGSPLNRKRSPHDPSPLTYNPFLLNLWI